LRIVALAVGLVHREALGGVDVFAEPWHSTLGLMHARLIGPAAVAVGTQRSRCRRPVTANVTARRARRRAFCYHRQAFAG
jgi:hypothetical protein